MSGKKPHTPLARPLYPEPLRKAIAQDIEAILESGRLMMGPWAKKFEERFAKITNRKHAVSVNSCTTALQISLNYADVGGADVLVPAGSFITDVSVVEFAGGRPILVDMNPDTLALDIEDLKRKLTPKTRAVIWVHLTGVIASDYQEILDFAVRHDLFVIEDAAHAHGAEIDGRPAGSFGDVSTFSFYPTKILTSGTGGILATDDPDLAKYAREVRMFGKDETTGEIVSYGNDWFLDEIRACIAYHHAGELEAQVARRRELAAEYHENLANQPGLRLLDVSEGNAPAWYQYPIFLDPAIDRQALVDTLKKKHGIEAKGIYKPAHQEQIFRRLDDGSLRTTEAVLNHSLCLPMHAGLDDAAVPRIAAATVEEIRKQTN